MTVTPTFCGAMELRARCLLLGSFAGVPGQMQEKNDAVQAIYKQDARCAADTL